MFRNIKITAVIASSILLLAGCAVPNNGVSPEPGDEPSISEDSLVFETVFSETLDESIELRIEPIRVKNFELYGANGQVLIWSDMEEKSGIVFFGEDTTALSVSSNWSDWGEAKCSDGLIFTAPLYEGFNEFVVTGEMLAIDREAEDSVKILGYASGPEGLVAAYTKDYDSENVFYSGTFVNEANEITKLVRGQIEKNSWTDSETQLLGFLAKGDVENGSSYESKYIYDFTGKNVYSSKTAEEWKNLLNEVYQLEIFNGLMYDLNNSSFYVASIDEDHDFLSGKVPEVTIKDLNGNPVSNLECNLIL
jgi:hypothetical protein